MKTRFFCLVLLCALLFCNCASRETRNIKVSDYLFQVDYSEKVCSGDLVYFTLAFPRRKKDYKLPSKVSARLIRKSTGKCAGETLANVVRQNPPLLFGAIPLSTWLDKGDFNLEIHYFDLNSNELSFNVPVTVEQKDFLSEDLYLNAKNTAIKSNHTPERAAQIDRLNEILYTKNSNSIFSAGLFSRPVESNRCTAFFGDRRNYIYNNGKKEVSEHYGIDYGVPTGTHVHACGDGKVVLAENRISTGWSVVIEHLPGLYSLYYHMDSLAVKEGDMLKKGSFIGYSGCTGLATGPHLHWEIRCNGVAVNPEYFMKHKFF